MRTKLKKLDGGKLATLLGALTSILTAFSFVDLDKMDFTLISTWVRLAVIAMPAAGGYMSTLNKPNRNDNTTPASGN